jgi:hypothetical protein
VSSLGGADGAGGACALPFTLTAGGSVTGRAALGAAGAGPDGAAGLACWPAPGAD